MLIHEPLALIIATGVSHGHKFPFLCLLVQTILLFKGDSHTNCFMISRIGKTSQHSLKLSTETMNKPLLLLGICTNMLWSILG
jgi:hypothetical protein